MLKVEAVVKDVFGQLSPRDDVSMTRFSELTLEVRKKVEGATEAERSAKQWLEYLLPPQEQEEYVLNESGMIGSPQEGAPPTPIITTSLRRLLDETSDLIDSPPFTHVLTLLLDAGFSTLVDAKLASQAYKVPAEPSSAPTAQITEIFDPKPVKLPIVLAILTKQAHSIGNGVPNEYLQAMESVRDLEAFAAVVYSSNWENDMVPFDEEEPGLKGEDVKKVAVDIKQKGVDVVTDVGAKIQAINVEDAKQVVEDVKEKGVAVAQDAKTTIEGLVDGERVQSVVGVVAEKGEEVVNEVVAGTESLVDVTKSTFESAWGKATESVKSDS